MHSNVADMHSNVADMHNTVACMHNNNADQANGFPVQEIQFPEPETAFIKVPYQYPILNNEDANLTIRFANLLKNKAVLTSIKMVLKNEDAKPFMHFFNPFSIFLI